VSIFAGTRGYLDKIDVAQVTRFEASMLGELRARKPEILAAILEKRELAPDIEKSLAAFLEDFAKGFA
jgi:F-type H+/Na+-transporting ATPase subunit alpha